MGTNFRTSVAWGWSGERKKLAIKAATVVPNYSTVLDRRLAMVGVNFRSTASNWWHLLLTHDFTSL